MMDHRGYTEREHWMERSERKKKPRCMSVFIPPYLCPAITLNMDSPVQAWNNAYLTALLHRDQRR